MKNLIIIGAGGLGRELLSYAIDIMETGTSEWQVKGFINDKLDALDGIDTGYQILGPIIGHKVENNAVYICAIGDGKARLDICRDLKRKGAKFINFIHPTARIRERVKMGVGNVFCPKTNVNPDVKIGDFVLLNGNLGIAHDCIIDDGCSLLGGNSVNGGCVLGKCVLLGANSVIVPGRKIGEYAKIGAGAVVFSNVKPFQTMIGNPARLLK